MRSATNLINFLTAPTFPEKLLKKHMLMVYIFYSACCFILIGLKNCYISIFRVCIFVLFPCNFDLFSVSRLCIMLKFMVIERNIII